MESIDEDIMIKYQDEKQSSIKRNLYSSKWYQNQNISLIQIYWYDYSWPLNLDYDGVVSVQFN